MLKKRKERIENDIETAKQNKEDALALKSEYEAKLKEADKEVEKILSEARKKALKKERMRLNNAEEKCRTLCFICWRI